MTITPAKIYSPGMSRIPGLYAVGVVAYIEGIGSNHVQIWQKSAHVEPIFQ